MRWFKHMSSSWDEEKLSLVVARHGLAGYGFWWRLMEIVAAQMDETGNASCAFPLKKWTQLFDVQPRVFLGIIKTLQSCGLIVSHSDETCDGLASNLSETCSKFVPNSLKTRIKLIKIEVPILLNLKDNHARNLQAKNRIRIDKDKEVELTPPYIPPVRGEADKSKTPPDPQPKPPVKRRSTAEPQLPDWLPKASWDEFTEHRRALRKPLTQLAKTKIINELDRLRASGNDPAEVIDQSIRSGWIGVFPLRPAHARGASYTTTSDGYYMTPYQRMLDNNRRAGEEFIAEMTKKYNGLSKLSTGHDGGRGDNTGNSHVFDGKCTVKSVS